MKARVEGAGIRPAPRRGNIRWNAVVRLASHVVTTALGVVAVGLSVRVLGVEAYGAVGTIGAIVGYAGVATAALTSTVGRAFVFAIEAGDESRASRELSTVVFGLVALLVLLLPIAGVTGWLFLESIIKLPAELREPSRYLLVLSLLTMACTTLTGPLGVSMFARNRLDLAGAGAIGRALVFLAMLWWLVGVRANGLVGYGVATLLASVLYLAWHIDMHRRLLPNVAIGRTHFDRRLLRDAATFGGWMTLNQIGVVVLLQTDVLVAGKLLGTKEAGQLAALASIALQVRTLAGVVSGLFAPDQVSLAAQGRTAEFTRYLARSLRLVTAFVAIVVGVLCGLAEPVLSHVLGTAFQPLASLAILMLAPMVPILGVMPAWNALLAVGRVRVPALATLATGVVGVGSAAWAASRGWGLPGVVAGSTLALALRNAVFAPIYLRIVCGVSVTSIGRQLLGGSVLGLGAYVLARASAAAISPISLIGVAGAAVVAIALATAMAMPFYWRDLAAGNRTPSEGVER